MKKVLYFLAICLWALGAVGGTGYACYCHAYLIAAGCVVCGWMGWPRVREFVDKLIFK